MRIGLLTSGGDCAGLNAVIRAVVKRAVLGYGRCSGSGRRRTACSRPVDAVELTPDSVAGLPPLGTQLGTTNQGDPFAYPAESGGTVDRSAEIAAGYHELGLRRPDRGRRRRQPRDPAAAGAQGDWRLIGIPKTIDNDLGHTERAIGFTSAVEVATEAVDRLHVTAASHSRVMVLEVMGRDAGHIALSAGIAGGADVILIPEIPYTLEAVCAKIDERRRGRNFSIVVVAESVRGQAGEPVTYKDAHGQSRYGGIGALVAHQVGLRTSCRDPGDGARPRAARRLAGAARSGAGVGVRRLCGGRSDRGWPLRSHGRLAEPRGRRRCDRGGGRPISGGRPRRCAGAYRARGLGIAFGDEIEAAG